MRPKWAWAAGVALAASSVRANPPFSFKTAIDGVGSFQLDQVDQVVAQDGGDVAAIVEYNGTSRSIAYQAGAGGTLKLIATNGDPIYGLAPVTSPPPPTPVFGNTHPFVNLSLSRAAGVEQATFVARPGISTADGSAGVYQYNINTNTGSRTLSTGDPTPVTGTFVYNAPGDTSDPALGLHVNRAGTALFAGTRQATTTDDVIVRGDATGSSLVQTGLNSGFNTPLSKKVITDTNHAVYLATSGAGYKIVDDASVNARVDAGASTTFGQVTPLQLFAATDSTELFTASLSGGGRRWCFIRTGLEADIQHWRSGLLWREVTTTERPR